MPSRGRRSRFRRYASRRRRRARFRITLPPSRRPTAKPTARGPGSRRHSSTNAGPSTRAPRRKSRSNSARDRSRSARGKPAQAGDAPATPLSLRVGVAPWRAAASEPSARPSSTSARGIRASWRAGDDSAETSSSRRPPGARNAHSPPILQMRQRRRQALGPCSARVARLPLARGPCYGWPPGSGGSAARARGARRTTVTDRIGKPSGQATTALLPKSYPPPWISVCVTRSGRKVPHAR
jgi:hypothetical protein